MTSPADIHFSVPVPVTPIFMSLDLFDPTQSATITSGLTVMLSAFQGQDVGTVPFLLGGTDLTLTNSIQFEGNAFSTTPYDAGTQFAVQCTGGALPTAVNVSGSVIYRIEHSTVT